jgi:predicted peroxiredoxin
MIRSVCEDLIPFIRNSIPPPMHYPSTGVGHYFAQGLIHMFYSTSIFGNLKGVYLLIKYSIVKGKKKPE